MKNGRWLSGLVLGLGIVLMVGCGDTDDGSGRGEFQRVPIGKGDSTLSCVNTCGKQAASGCWCDESCSKYGDCCADKKQACDQAQPSCAGTCGGKSKDGCWCDELCAKYGDCCPDKDQVCAAGPATCKANADCGKDEYCELASGCLDGKAEGACKPKPTVCAKGGTGVCGCDDKTYFNSCEAHAAGTNVAANNKCPQDIQCGGIAGIMCPKGYKCWITETYPDASGKCVKEDFCNSPVDCQGLTSLLKCWGDWTCEKHTCKYKCGHINPTCYVGGCSSELCTDKKDAVSACVALPWYQCLKHTQCGNFTANGACTWKPTTAYIDCMAKFGKVVCDWDGDPNKTYVVKSADQCKTVKFTCSTGLSPFFDDCGCGCKK